MTHHSKKMLQLAQQAKEASQELAKTSTQLKNQALEAMATQITQHQAAILQANQRDIQLAQKHNIKEAMIERLKLDESRVQAMAEGIRNIACLADPIGRVDQEWLIDDGLRVARRCVPLGVLAIIYESRPNVTADAAALCLKTSNAVILRGGKEALLSNLAIQEALQQGLKQAGLNPYSIQLIPDSKRQYSQELMTLSGYVDCLIPRGSKALIQAVVSQATVPVIQTAEGNDHLYIHHSADLKMAEQILINTKTQRPSVCNAIESLIIDRSLAERHLPQLLQKLKDKGVELRGDHIACTIDSSIEPACEKDWEEEYLDLILAVKVVEDYEQAIEHINRYSSKHSEAIVSSDYQVCQDFLDQIDAAAVYVNASTRFTDGEVFGFGGEMGISTQKLHARGPMGLEALTSYKYTIQGQGHIRM